MERFYNYAVIRAIPDPRRGEIVNIGLAVFHEQSVDVRMAPSLGKILALDPGLDIEQYQRIPESIAQWSARFDSVPERYEAIKHFGIVTLTELGSFRTTPSINYEDHVRRLMTNLVVPPIRENQIISSANRITTSLRQIFRSRDVLGKTNDDIGKHLIVPNFPLDPEENLYADFALKNGAYWITETADFRARSKSSMENSRVAAFAAIKLLKAKKKFPKVKTFVVYASQSDASVAGQLNLLGDHTQELINLESKQDMGRYMNAIMGAAGATAQLPH